MRNVLGRSNHRRRTLAISRRRKVALLGAFGVVLPLVLPVASSAAKEAPTLSAVHAVFDQEARATYYSVAEIKIPTGAMATVKPSYKWHLSPPPDDPSCHHFQASASSDLHAVWFHADVTLRPEDDCHHRTTMHNGTVTLTATLTLSTDSRPWTCIATYFGTLSGDGEPGLCTITAPAFVPVERPKTPWKVKWKNAGEFADDYGTGIAAVGGVLAATGVGKPVAPLWGAAGAGFKGIGKALVLKAGDPADPKFNTIVSPRAPLSLHVKSSVAIPNLVASAANALADNVALTLSLTEAFVTSLNRAQGASEARNSSAERKQEQAAAGFALGIANLDDARASLRDHFKLSLVAAGIHASMTPTQFRLLQQQVAKDGLSQSFVLALHSTGASNAVIEDIAQGIIAARIPSATIDLPAGLSDPKFAMTDSEDATLMRAYVHLVQG